MSSWIFKALPPFIGGKRKLVPFIFGALGAAIPPSAWQGLRFLDPFVGGGAISLAAKWLGFEVICGDVALRSVTVGKALIENSTARLSPVEVLALMREEHPEYERVAERHSPQVFPLEHARFLDRALAVAHGLPSPRRELAALVLVKWALRVQPMSQLRGTDARAAACGDLDRVSPRRLGHYIRSRRLLAPAALFKLADEVNGGVFQGCGRAYQMDALEFLRRFDGDVLYLDPPYPGTAAYEKEYRVLDELLEAQTHLLSRFSRPSAAPALDDLLDAATTVPLWLISMGGSPEDRRDLERMTSSHDRRIKAWSVPYQHLGSIASSEKNAMNVEHLVLAERR